VADPKEELEKDESTATEAAEAAARRKARRAARAKARDEAAAEAAEADDTTEADDSDEAGDEDESSDDEQEEAAEGEKAEGAVEAKPNRRERRRRKKLGDDADLPRDRNARIRAQHARKKSPEEEEALTPLSTGEMIDDALARGTARAGKWAKHNANLLQGLLGAALLAGIGYGVYHWQTSAKSELASSDLNLAVQADRARIDPAAKPDDDDTIQVYKSAAERNSAALASYRKARSDREGSGTALLARLGEAGVLLDQHSYDEALAAYREVKASPLAAADPDVRGRAIEGIGFALEGKGDLNGAAGAFKELDTITGLKTFKELGMYHQARILAAQGNKEQALKLIKEARERLQTTGESRNASYLMGVLDELQRKLDPTSSPKRGIGGAGKQLSVEELQKLQQQIIREMQKAQEKGEHQDEH
jgi:hypothetical protein